MSEGSIFDAGEDDLLDGLAELSALALGGDALVEQLQRLVEVCTSTISGISVAGVTLMEDGKPDTVAVTDDKVLAVDRRQYGEGRGPCLDAIRLRQVVRADNDGDSTPWPSFAEEARAVGCLSFLAAPILIGDDSVGSLNLYGLERDAFDRLDERPVALFAGQAGPIVANDRAVGRLRAVGEQLEQAMASRAVIEQAKGVVMAQHGVDADAAFAVLRQLSQRRNEKLRAVAQRVIAGARPSASR